MTQFSSRSFAPSIVVTLLPLVGCAASVHVASNATVEALRNKPGDDNASLYMLRPGGNSPVRCFPADLDGRAWGVLLDGQYAWDPLPAGSHVVRGPAGAGVPFQATAGKTYFFEVQGSRLVSVTESQGQKDLQLLPMTMNPTHWLLRQYVTKWPSVQLGMTPRQVDDLIDAPLDSAADLSEQTHNLGGAAKFSGVDLTGRSFELHNDGTYTQSSGSGDRLAGYGPGDFDFVSGELGYHLIFKGGRLMTKEDGHGVIFSHNFPSSTQPSSQLPTLPECRE